jgi:leishmanolysin
MAIRCDADDGDKHRHHHSVMAEEIQPPTSHSCIHDVISAKRRYSISPQVYEVNRKGRTLLALSGEEDVSQPIRIYLNYDAVGLSSDRDCHAPGQIVKVSTWVLPKSIF